MFGAHTPPVFRLGGKLQVMSGTTHEVLLLNSTWVGVRGFPRKRDGGVTGGGG